MLERQAILAEKAIYINAHRLAGDCEASRTLFEPCQQAMAYNKGISREACLTGQQSLHVEPELAAEAIRDLKPSVTFSRERARSKSVIMKPGEQEKKTRGRVLSWRYSAELT